MKRREFVKYLTLSTGVLLLPSPLISLVREQKLKIVIVGGSEIRHAEQFCKQNAITSITSIGWYQDEIHEFSISNNNIIDFDFLSINIDWDSPLNNSVLVPQNIKDVFIPHNNYLIICSLYKLEAILSKEIINWLENEEINFWFFGSITFFNPSLVPWSAKLFTKFENNPRVSIYDGHVYFNKLRYENGTQLFTEAVKKCDEKLLQKLNDFCKREAAF